MGALDFDPRGPEAGECLIRGSASFGGAPYSAKHPIEYWAIRFAMADPKVLTFLEGL